MGTASGKESESSGAALIRIGGVAGLLAFCLHVLINYMLIELPPRGSALQAYLARDLGATLLGHGLRYPAFFCLALFAAGMFLMTAGGKSFASHGWGLLALVGATSQITTGVIANTIQTAALLRAGSPPDPLSNQVADFSLLWNLGRLLFRVEPMFGGLMFAGFSVAGWQSATLPRWFAVLGVLVAVLNLLVAILVAWILAEHAGSQFLLWTRTLLGLAWFLGACTLMLRGRRGG